VTSSGADVTAVVACFNYGRFVGEAVESLLSQEGGAPRVIVVDDGSTDPATHVALDELPGQVEVIRQENRGVCAARNAGLERANTPYALVLDADDRLAPGALSAMRGALDADGSLGFAYGYMRFFGDWEGVVHFPPYDPYGLLYRHTIGLTALMRREVVEQTGGFDPDFEQFEDWELWVNALEHSWRGRRVDAVTLEYRRHPGTKQGADRTRYREMFRQLRRKHAVLYARRGELAGESGLSLAARLFYRLYWGPRPLPARLERALYDRVFGARRSG
jgi:glycosyltransferase involved in cell wall biosynthesis